MDINNLTITGRLVKEVEIRQSKTGTICASFSIATSTNLKDTSGNPITAFFNCKAYGKTAENLSKFTRKGAFLLLQGSLGWYQYEKEGKKNTVIEINVMNFINTTPRDKTLTQEEVEEQTAQTMAGVEIPNVTANESAKKLDNISDDDLPF